MDYTDELRNKFAQFLQPLGVSRNTYKNYLSDLLHFFDWTSSQGYSITPEGISQTLVPQFLALYRDHLISHSPVATANRRLSTIRKFCQFAYSQSILPSDPSANLTNISQPLSPQEAILGRFRSLLKSEGASIVTIKNYLSDARHYMQFSPDLNPDLTEYNAYLEKNFSPSTALRRISAVKKLVTFLSQSPTYELPTPPTPLPTPEPPLPEIVTSPSSPMPETTAPTPLLNLLDLPEPVLLHPSTPPPPSHRKFNPTFLIISGAIIVVLISIIIAYLLATNSSPQMLSPQSKSNSPNSPSSTRVLSPHSS